VSVARTKGVHHDEHNETVYENRKFLYKDNGGHTMVMIFTDGMEIKTTGPYRIIREADGLYVVGEGSLYPVDTQEEAEQVLCELISQNAPSSIKDH